MVGTAANVLKESLDSQRVFGRFGYFFSGRKPNARIVSKGLRVFDSFRNSLSNQWREKLRVGPVVAWFARQISDPVVRLRFLRAVMLPGQPRYPPRRPYTFWFLVSFPVLLLFFTA